MEIGGKAEDMGANVGGLGDMVSDRKSSSGSSSCLSEPESKVITFD